MVASNGIARDTHLRWDASDSTNVDGYKLFYGYESLTYIYEQDCGDVLDCWIYGLNDNYDYYIAAKAYGMCGDPPEYCESSEYSNEVILLADAPVYNFAQWISLTHICEQGAPPMDTDYEIQTLSDGSILYIFDSVDPGTVLEFK